MRVNVSRRLAIVQSPKPSSAPARRPLPRRAHPRRQRRRPRAPASPAPQRPSRMPAQPSRYAALLDTASPSRARCRPRPNEAHRTRPLRRHHRHARATRPAHFATSNNPTTTARAAHAAIPPLARPRARAPERATQPLNSRRQPPSPPVAAPRQPKTQYLSPQALTHVAHSQPRPQSQHPQHATRTHTHAHNRRRRRPRTSAAARPNARKQRKAPLASSASKGTRKTCCSPRTHIAQS